MGSCLFCNGDLDECRSIFERDIFPVKCPRCGEYTLSREASYNMRRDFFTPRQRANASGWLRENQNFFVKSDNYDHIFNQKTLSFHERADKLLLALEKETEYAGQLISFDAQKDVEWQAKAWCINSYELLEIKNFLKSTQRVNDTSEKRSYVRLNISPEGWAHIETLKKSNPESHQGFVAMWFDDSMQEVYDSAIAPAIEDAGYKPLRVDQREYNDKIDDEIILQIRRSRFVVADFTGHRGGVYYEAGFAKGLNLEVFWTCRADDSILHFDIQQYNFIFWESGKLDVFRSRLAKRIEAILGRGTYIQQTTTGSRP